MTYKTFGELKEDVLREVDMEAEDFIQSEELPTMFNDAVREARAHIQKLGLEDDYFNKTQSYSLTSGQIELDLPADIYAAKIRGLVYASPSKIYPITRIKGPGKFLEIQNLIQQTGGDIRFYDIENSSPTTGFKLKLYPVSSEDTSNCIHLTYIRNCVEVSEDADLVDIPEFYSFVKAFVKWKLFAKENGDQAVQAKADYVAEKDLMIQTLSEMTPDYDSTIPGDTSIYEEMS